MLIKAGPSCTQHECTQIPDNLYAIFCCSRGAIHDMILLEQADKKLHKIGPRSTYHLFVQLPWPFTADIERPAVAYMAS